MSNDSDCDTLLGHSIANPGELDSHISEDVKSLLSRLDELLKELDDLQLPMAAAYLSMAIYHVEADLRPN